MPALVLATPHTNTPRFTLIAAPHHLHSTLPPGPQTAAIPLPPIIRVPHPPLPPTPAAPLLIHRHIPSPPAPQLSPKA